MKLDHIAIVAADLDAGTAAVEAAFGVALGPGGRHDAFGTHNRLLGLGPGLYLEVIAPDPGAVPPRPRWFGLEMPPAEPRIGNWIVRVEDLGAALADAPATAGDAIALTRGAYAWRIAVPPDGSLPMDGGWPTMIEWAPGAHPSDALGASPVRFVGLEIGHPAARDLAARLVPRLGDPRIVFTEVAVPRLRATFDTPRGRVVL